MKAILMIIAMMILIISGCSQLNQRGSKYCEDVKEGTWDYDCCEDCHKFDYEFLNYYYNSGGIGREGVEDCFCKNGNESIQIY